MDRNNCKKLLEFLIIFLAVALVFGSVSALSSLKVADSITDFQVKDSDPEGNWTVYFNSTQDNQLSSEILEEGSKLSFNRLQYRQDGQWIDQTATESGDTVTASWEGSSNSYGRIVYDVNKFGSYKLNLSIGDQTRTVGTPGKAEQGSVQFDLNDPIIPYELCGFSSNYWLCQPKEMGETWEPGYRGEVLDLSPKQQREFEIPSNANVKSFSLDVQSVENESIQELSGQGIRLADLMNGDKDEIILYEGSKVKVYNASGTSQWNYSVGNQINDISSGDIDILSGKAELVVSDENSLKVISGNSSSIWNLTGHEYFQSAVGQLSADNSFYSADDGDADNFTCLECGSTNTSRFTIPYSFNDTSGTVYIKTAFNYYNKSAGDLKFNLNGSTYDVDDSTIKENAVTEYSSDDSGFEDMAGIGGSNLTLQIIDPDFNSRKIYLRLPLAKNSSTDKNLSLDLGTSTYEVSGSDINALTSISTANTSANHKSATANINNEAVYGNNFSVPENSSIYIGAPFNRIDGENSDITLELNNNAYKIEAEKIDDSAEKSFKQDDGVPDSAETISSTRESRFNLGYSVPSDLNSEHIYIKSALSYYNSKAGKPYLEINGSQYDIDRSQITAESEASYSINDGESEEKDCIGCEDDLNPPHPLFDISAFNLSNLNAESAIITAPICYRGSTKIDDLVLKGSGLSGNSYDVNISEIPSCDTGSKWINTTVNGEDLQEDFILYNCKNCNSTDHYELKADNSTNGNHSQFYEGTGTEYNRSLNYDYMVNLSTASSLEYSWVETRINKSDIEQGKNITFKCNGCGSSQDYYRIMSDSSNSGLSYHNNGSGFQPISQDYMLRIWTNTSLNSTWAYTRVNSSDLNSTTNVTFKCDGCSSGYNIIYDEEASGNSYLRGSSLSGQYLVKRKSRLINYSWTEVEVGKQELRDNKEIRLSCDNCSGNEYFTPLDSSSSKKAYRNTSSFDVKKDFGSAVRVWTNSSLEFDWVRTKIDGKDLETGQNITYYCENCSGRAFNIMSDDNSSASSYSYSNGYNEIEEGYLSRVEVYGSNQGEEVVATRYPQLISAKNSSSNEIWNYSAGARPYDISIGEVTGTSTGNEVVVATKEGILMLDSSGTSLNEYPSSGSTWFRTISLLDLDSSGQKEIIGGTDKGEVIALESDFSEKWSTDAGSRVTSTVAGNLSKKDQKTIVAGLDNGSFVMLNSSGQILDIYDEPASITAADKGNVDSTKGKEVGISTSTDARIYNLYNLPANLSADIGGDGSKEWNKTGIFTGSSQLSGSAFAQAFNNELEACGKSLCNVSLLFNTDSGGKIRVKNPSLTYDYNASEDINYSEGVTRWAKRKNVNVGEEIMYNGLELVYSNTAVPIRIEQLTSSKINNVLNAQGVTEVVFNDRRFTIDQPYINFPEDLEYFVFNSIPRSDDYIWYNNSKATAPISLNKSDLIGTGSEAYYNTTVYRNTNKTSSDFVNVTVEIKINDSKVSGNNYLEVDWDQDGNYTDITPSSSGCGSREKITADSADFYVCMADNDSNGKIDKFNWIQPKVGSDSASHNLTQYKSGGKTNIAPTLVDRNVTTPGKWGENFVFNASFNDQENNSVNTTIWVKVNGDWSSFASKNVEENASYNLTSYKNWTGLPGYKFEYQDVNSSLGEIHDLKNSSEETFTVNKHSTSTIYEFADKEVNQSGETADFKVKLRDDHFNTSITGDEFCVLYLDGDLEQVRQPNSTGHCSYEMSNFDKKAGEYEWYVRLDQNDYYLSSKTSPRNISIFGQYSFNEYLNSKEFYRPESHDFSSIVYNYTDIEDQVSNNATPEFTVEWAGTTTDSGTAFNSNITGTIDLLDNENLGYKWFNVTLNDTYYRYKKISTNLTVYGIAEAALSSEDHVFASEDRINLTANITNKLGNDIPAKVNFNTPAGTCVNTYSSGNSYACEFDPDDSLNADNYTWYVDIEKDFYQYEQNATDSFQVGTPIEANVQVDSGPVNRFNESSGNTSISYNVSNITDGSSALSNVGYQVNWSGEKIDSGTAGTSGFQSAFDVPNNESLNLTELKIELEKQNYRQLNYTQDIKVKGNLNATLNSSDIVYAKSDTINLTANITDKLRNPITATVNFDTPPGSCVKTYSSSNSYACEFDPDDSLSVKTYNWSVEVSKPLYSYEQDINDSFDIKTGIKANLTLTQGELYRYNGSNGTTDIQYTVTNITDGANSPLDNVNYTVYWSDKIFNEGITNSSGFNSSFDVPDNETLGSTEFRLVLDKDTYRPYNISRSRNVKGTLNVTTLSTSPVFRNNSETFGDASYDLKTDLEVNVENMLGENITGGSAQFNVPAGSCDTQEVGSGIYKCEFNPNVVTPIGYNNWDAEFSKTGYKDTGSGTETVLLKNVLKPLFESDLKDLTRLQNNTLKTKLVKPSGGKASTSDFNVSYYLENSFEKEVPTSDGRATYDWQTSCQDLPQSYSVTVNTTDTSAIYDLYQSEDSGLVGLYDNATVNITSPKDINNGGTNYQQGDNVNLEMDINDSCGAPNSSINYEVVWNASDKDSSELIGNGESRTWTIPNDISGETNLTSYINYEYYEQGFETHEMLVERVLNVNISDGHGEKIRNYGGNRKFEFQADIVTGNGVKANESTINETFSDFNITWYIDGDKKKEVPTDENGTAETNLQIEDSYKPGNYPVKAYLENTTSIDTVVLQENESINVDVNDKSNVTLHKPDADRLFYAEEYPLRSTVTTATGAADQINISFNWIYQDSDTSPITINSEQNSTWNVPRYAYGEGNVTVEATNEFIIKSNDSKPTNGSRYTSIEEYKAPKYLPPTGITELLANISIEGLDNKSEYEVEFWIGNLSNNYMAETNNSGIATHELNTTDKTKGAYDTGIIIRDNRSKHLITQEPSEENKTLVIPDVLNVSAYWRDNNEAIFGTKNESDVDGENYPNLPNKAVYRNPGPWKEPDIMYLGANVTTPFASEDTDYDVNNATAEFWLNGTSSDGTNVNEMVASCTVNKTEFEEKQNDNSNTWDDDFLCDTKWNPRSDFPVGSYNLTINASHPENGWNSNPIYSNVEVRGVLNITIDDPPAYEDTFQMDNFTMSATVTDQNGKEFSASELDEIHWTLEEDTCANYGEDGGGSGKQVMDWDSAIAHGGRSGKLSTWIVMGDTGKYDIGGNEMVWLDADKNFFDVTRNNYRRGFKECSAVHQQWTDTKGDITDQYEGDMDKRVGQVHDIRARIEAKWNSPTQQEVETNDNDMLNVSARFYQYNTSNTVPNDFDGTYYATCLNCTDSQNKDLSQREFANGSEDEAKFRFNFSNEEYGKNYTIKIWGASLDSDYGDEYPFNTTSRNFTVYRDLGSGDGACNINNKCEPSQGENVEVCPSECGYDNLPDKFWVNQTADEEQNQTQYNQFKNDSSNVYEANASYYEAHSNYSDDGAGGCNFDGEKNSTYEDADYCPDMLNLESPPEVKNSGSSKKYVRPGGTSVTISADVKDTNGNLNLVNLTDREDNSIVDYMSTTSGSCSSSFCSYTLDLTLSQDRVFKIYANDSKGNVGTDSEFQIFLDSTEVSITSIDTPEGPFAEGENIPVTVNLTNVDSPDPRPKTVNYVNVEGDDIGFNSGSQAWETTISASSSDSTINVEAKEIAGYTDTDSKSYIVDTTTPNVTKEKANKSLVGGGEPVALYANITDNYLDATWVERDGTTVCDNQTFAHQSGDTYTCNITTPGSTGTYTYTIKANDTVGHLNDTETIDIEVDATKPSVTNTAINDTVVNSGQTVKLSSDISDQHLDQTLVTSYYENWADNEPSNSGGEEDCTELKDGGEWNDLSCNDGGDAHSGLCERDDGTYYTTSSKTWVNARDTCRSNGDHLAVVENQSENDNIASNYGNVWIGYNDRDEEDRFVWSKTDATGEIYCDENEFSDTGGGTFECSIEIYDNQGLASYANDTLGNWDFQNVSIDVDDIEPSIKINQPVSKAYAGNLQVNSTVIDNHLRESSVEYLVEESGSNDTYSLKNSNADYWTDTLDTTSYNDGNHTIYVRADDEADNTGINSTTDIQFDNTAPTITFDSPTDGDDLNAQTRFNLTINDSLNNDNVSAYKYRIKNGSGVQKAYTTLTQDTGDQYYKMISTSDYADGDYDFEVRARDTVGNTRKSSITVKFDNQPPEVTINNPAPNQNVRQNITVEATINDKVNNGDPATYECQLDTLSWKQMSQVSGNDYDCQINTTQVSDGKYNVSVRANDTFDQKGTDSVEINIDNTPPDINTVEINDSIVQTGMGISVNVTTPGDDSSSLQYLEIDDFVNISYDGGDSQWEGVTEGGAGGNSVIDVFTVDLAGNTDTNNSVSYTIDDEPPVFKQNSRNVTYMQTGDTVNVSTRVNETHLRENKVNIEILDNGGSLAKDVSESYSVIDTHNTDYWSTWNGRDGSSNPVSDGNYTFKVYAEDKADNTNTYTHSNEFVVDNTVPAFNSFSVNDSYINNQSTVRFTVDVNDRTFNASDTDINLVQVSDGSLVTDVSENCDNSGSCSATWTPTTEPEGNYTFKITSTDKAGNTNTKYQESAWVEFDETPPDLDTVTINDSIVQTGMPISVEATTPGDTGSDLDYVEVDDFVNLSYSGSNTWTGNTEGGAGGNSVIDVFAVDLADNTDTNNSVSYIIDDNPPEFKQFSRNKTYMQTDESINLSVRVNETYLREGQVNIEVVDDARDLVEDVSESYSRIDAHNTDYWSNWNGRDSGSQVADGNYTFRVYAEDKADNTNTEAYSNEFVVDNSVPTFSGFSVDKKYVNNESFVSFSVDVDDLTFDPSSTDITVVQVSDGSLVTNVSESCDSSGSCSATWNPSSEPAGNYTFKITSTDKAGNTNSEYQESAWTYYDKQPPVVNNVSINDTIVQTGASIEVVATVTEDQELNSVTADGNSLSYNGSHWTGTTTGEADETVNVRAEDLAGNTGTNDSATYTIDDTAPQLSKFNSNASFDISRSDILVRFHVNVSEPNLRTVKIENKSSGSFANLTSGAGDTYYMITEPQNLGMDQNQAYNITVRSTDQADNTAKTYYELKIDDRPLNVTRVELNDTVVQSNSDINVNATVEGSRILDVKANGNLMSKTGNFWLADITVNSSTQNPVNVTARNKADTVAQNITQEYTIDDTPPTISSFIENTTFGITNSEAAVRFNASVTDANLRDVLLNGTQMQQDGDWTLTTKPATQGCPTGVEGQNCVLQLYADDKADNVNTDSLNITIDDQVPSVTNADSNTTLVKSGDLVRFTANVTDPYLEKVEITNSSGAQCTMSQTTGTGYACNITVGQTSNYTFEATDKAPNINDTNEIRVDVDNTPPNIQSYGSNATFNTSRSNETLNFTAFVTDVHLEDVRLNATSMKNNTDNDWYNISKPMDIGCPTGTTSNCLLEFKAEDIPGNTETEYYNLKIDDEKPIISRVKINDSIIQSNSSIQVTVNVSGESDRTLQSVKAENQALSWNGSKWTGAVQVDNDGSVNVTAIDKADNTDRNNSVNYTIDDTAPQLSKFNSNASFDAARSDAFLKFNLSATDTHLRDVEIYNGSSDSWQIMTNETGSEYSETGTPSAFGCPTGVNLQNCTIQARAFDEADNKQTISYDIRVDDVKPEYGLVKINDSIVQPNSVIETTVNLTNSGQQETQHVRAEGQGLNYSSGQWRGKVTIDNDTYINVTARDLADNVGTNETVRYTVDYIAPNATNLSSNSTDDIVSSNEPLNFTVNASDTNGVKKVTLEGQHMNSSGQGYWHYESTASNLGCSEGNCILNSTVTDEADRINWSTYNLSVDDTSPNVTAFEPLNATEGTPPSAKGEWYLDWELNVTDHMVWM